MIDPGICLQTDNSVLRSVVVELERGRELIERLDDVTYRRSANGTGSVGGHFRHNLDFVNNFLNGVDGRRIDYNARERDARIEIDRGYAVEKLGLAMCRMCSLTDEDLDRLVYVRSEVDLTTWQPSSVARELEFINSHTVHHHALIAEKLAGFGITVMEHFGVAPSTLEYWKTKAA
ncbi:MAG: hypothetical protein IT173_08170 [Acidobacteria bacterium]|nr:hypothetical protein [Acidobacteriota bacterium]